MNKAVDIFKPPFSAKENEAETKAGKYVIDSNGVFFCEADSVKHAKELVKHLNKPAIDLPLLTEVFELLTLAAKKHTCSYQDKIRAFNKVDAMRARIRAMIGESSK